MTQEYRIWKPEHDGHAPPNWREGMEWATGLDSDGMPMWRGNTTYAVPAEALNSPNDDARDGEPTDPRKSVQEALATPREVQMQGMTLRDYFAAAALQGLMSACDQAGTWTSTEAATGYAAKFAYNAADAMIAERSKRDA